jgi:hypothetical protein
MRLLDAQNLAGLGLRKLALLGMLPLSIALADWVPFLSIFRF